MKADVRIVQLESDSHKCYFNVDDDIYNGIGIWGTCWEKVTLFVRSGTITFGIYQFDDMKSCKEWYENDGKFNYDEFYLVSAKEQK